MNPKLLGYLRLMRPANLPTAAADILAGIAIAVAIPLKEGSFGVFFHPSIVLSLIFSSVLLYAGGVVLNDVFDAKLDAIERPERAIPSGLILKKNAAIFGTSSLVIGIILAFSAHMISGIIACILAFSIVLYDAVSKNYDFLGPLNMGICRGLNLILGITVFGTIKFPALAIIPIIYIFAITLISRGEVHGNNKKNIIWAGILYGIVLLSLFSINLYFDFDTLYISIFILFFGFSIFFPLVKAYRKNSPKNIKKAVITGVLSIIILDACFVALFTHWWIGIPILLLLPLSLLLSKLFAVT